jgi:hypothetical protein
LKLCPAGFTWNDGDVPGFGIVGDTKNINKRDTIE